MAAIHDELVLFADSGTLQAHALAHHALRMRIARRRHRLHAVEFRGGFLDGLDHKVGLGRHLR